MTPLSSAEQAAAMEVEAYVVDVENAADADEDGLVNPLLHCYQDCVFNVNVWALPAVQAWFPILHVQCKLQEGCSVCTCRKQAALDELHQRAVPRRTPIRVWTEIRGLHMS